MKKVLDLFVLLQSEFAGKLVLTGSNALSLYGFGRPNSNDLDIIILYPTAKDFERMKAFEKLSPIPQYQNEHCEYLRKAKWEVKAQFLFGGIKVDMFTEYPVKEQFYLSFEYANRDSDYNVKPGETIHKIMINDLFRIINAKKRFGRSKDWTKILEMSATITGGLMDGITNLGRRS